MPPRDWRGAPGIHYRGLKMSLLLPFKRAPEPRAPFSCCCAAQYSFEEMLCSDKITADNVNPRLHFNFVLHFLWYVLILKIFRVPFFFFMIIKQLFIQHGRAISLPLPPPLPISPSQRTRAGGTVPFNPEQLQPRAGAEGKRRSLERS